MDAASAGRSRAKRTALATAGKAAAAAGLARLGRRHRFRRVGASEVLAGALAGAAGGAAGSWTMNLFQSLLQRKRRRGGSGGSAQQQGGEPSTAQVASVVSRGVAGKELSAQQKKRAAPIVHYGYGTIVGGAYGALSEYAPQMNAWAGAPFGAAVWFVGDEVAVPAMGLSKPPTRYPLTKHAESLGAHLVYGVTAELVRRAVRRLL